MRKRSKILAIILSVAMVGSMWSPVFAEETTDTVGETVVQEAADEEAVEEEAVIEPVAETEAPVEVMEEVQPDAVDDGVEKISWDYTNTTIDNLTAKIWIKYFNNETAVSYDVPGTVTKAATCKDKATVHFEYYCADNQTTYTADAEVEGNVDHVYTSGKKSETVVVTAATHTQEGVGYYWDICDVCGEAAGTGDGRESDPTHCHGVTIPVAEHTYTGDTLLIPVTKDGTYTANDTSESNLKVKSVNCGKDDTASFYVLDLDSAGKPQLITPTKDGYYASITLCSEYDGTTDKGIKGLDLDSNEITSDSKVETVSATEVAAAKYAEISNVENIANLVKGTPVDLSSDGKFTAYDEADIELTDCTKSGSYTVTFYSDASTHDKTTEINAIEYSVKAHHYTKTLIEISAADAGNVAVDYTAEKGYTVTNKTCQKDISYSEVTVCTAAGCKESAYTADLDKTKVYNQNGTPVASVTGLGKEISRTSKTAEKATTHSSAKSAVDEIVKSMDGKATYDAIYNALVADNDIAAYIKAGTVVVTPSTTSCQEAGKATIEYKCLICGEALASQTEEVAYIANTGAHNLGTKTVDTSKTVEATCTKEGSFTMVQKCQSAGCEYTEETVQATSTVKHSNEETKSTVAGTGSDTSNNTKSPVLGEIALAANKTAVVDASSVLANAYKNGTDIKDETFGNYNLVIGAYTVCSVCGGNKTVLTSGYTLKKVTVDSLTKEGKLCDAGSITLTVTYSYTYIDSTTKKEVDATATATGTFDYFSSSTAENNATEHVPGEWTKVVTKEATTTENGAYDLVIYCKVCGKELSRKTGGTIPATGTDTKLPAVQNLKAETKSMNRVKLTWDKLDGAIGYIVLGLNETGRYGNQIAYTTQTSWTDTAADSEAYNFYWVVGVSKNAENKNVVGELGSYVYAIGRVVGATTNLAAKTANNGVTLTWTKASNANGYVILSRKGSTGKANKLTSVGDVASYTDTTADGTTFYWVYGTYTNEEGKTVVAGATSNYAYATK